MPPSEDEFRYYYRTYAGRRFHWTETGDEVGSPIVFLHQTPRSWREFEFVAPHIPTQYRCIFLDMPGFGGSQAPKEWTIPALADGVETFISTLDAGPVALVGHHTGGVVALELCRRDQGQIERTLLSCLSYHPAPGEDESAESSGGNTGNAGLDDNTPAADGSHLMRLWNDRAAYYPQEGRTQLLQRTIGDIFLSDDPAAGHAAVHEYFMEPNYTFLPGRIIYLTGSADPSYRSRSEMAQALGAVSVVDLEGGTVAIPEQYPREFAVAVEQLMQL